ncbi:HAD-IA family hydrolase [Salinicoccus carnicancri]|uniref:HAD-IA family hydrolase n=1 Tax=Salinicoccus carnicancri TaxID=558170 RepID=UPI000302C520|nr:HAD-IA family hydrolase [Salinicoccus carnicancri]
MSIGVILDFDGTIIDSETNLYNAINRNLADRGHKPLEIERYKESIGSESDELDDYILERVGEEGVRAIAEDHLRTCLDLECYPHILKLMDYCRNNGIPMAVATSSRREDITPLLQHFGILDAFVSVRGKEDVEHVKPDPALYRLAGEDLGLPSANIYAIEDTVNGSLAAVRAGMNAIVLTNEMTGDMDFGMVDYFAKDIKSEEIIAILEGEPAVTE